MESQGEIYFSGKSGKVSEFVSILRIFLAVIHELQLVQMKNKKSVSNR